MTTKFYCTNCGKEMNHEAEVCTSCGVRVGRVINNCYSCGNEIQENQELCLNCGVNPRKIRKNSFEAKTAQAGTVSKRESVNSVLAVILGFMLPGLPSIIWFGQKTKGISLLVSYFVLLVTIPFLTFILCPAAAVDAYKIAQKVNSGEVIEEWTFF